MSFNFANALRDELKAFAWDLVVIDEAHKLRNAYRPSNKVGQGIRWATEDCRKLLLTATPLQNSLLELYGLSTLDRRAPVRRRRTPSGRSMPSAGSSLADLRQRLVSFCKRTLRNQVTEYIRYTERRPITRPFTPTDDEHALYEAVSGFLQREDSYALPQRQRHLTALILRKLLASSSHAIAGTLDTLRIASKPLRDEQAQERSGVRRAADRGRGDRRRTARRDPRRRRGRAEPPAAPAPSIAKKLREEIDDPAAAGDLGA